MVSKFNLSQLSVEGTDSIDFRSNSDDDDESILDKEGQSKILVRVTRCENLLKKNGNDC